MRFSKPLIAAALAISMSGTPVLAQSAAPLSIAAPLSVAARSGAPTDNANQFDNERLLPALVIIAILAAAILVSHNQDGVPHSP
jgi:hypothetical protein